MLPRNVVSKIEKLITTIEIDGYEDKKGFHLDFENTVYMQDSLIGIMNDSIYQFALKKDEINALSSRGEYGQMKRDAWSRFSKAQKSKKGDFGELLLFILLSHFYDAQKIVTKVKLRSSLVDQVKGYDCAHFTKEDGKLWLWLGEAKLHKSFSGGLSDAIESINEHVKVEYLKNEISILRTNLELEKSTLQEEVEDLLTNPPPIYKLNLKIPILLGYEWQKLQNLDRESFIASIKCEITDKFKLIRKRKKEFKTQFKLIFIILPFKDMDDFKNKLDQIEQASRIGS